MFVTYPDIWGFLDSVLRCSQGKNQTIHSENNATTNQYFFSLLFSPIELDIYDNTSLYTQYIATDQWPTSTDFFTQPGKKLSWYQSRPRSELNILWCHDSVFNLHASLPVKNLSALQKIVGEMQGGDQGIGCWREPPAASWALTWPPSSSGWRALLFQTASSGPSKNIFGVLLCKYEMLLSYWCGCSVDFSCSTYSLCNSCMILLLCSTHIIQIAFGVWRINLVYTLDF